MFKGLIVSHKGNLNGINSEFENNPFHITHCIKKYPELCYELDVWVKNSKIYLGHDKPTRYIDISFFYENSHKLILHLKNLEAIRYFQKTNFTYFIQDKDDYSIVENSHGWIWANYGRKTNKDCILMLEKDGKIPRNCGGICTDNPLSYLKL